MTIYSICFSLEMHSPKIYAAAHHFISRRLQCGKKRNVRQSGDVRDCGAISSAAAPTFENHFLPSDLNEGQHRSPAARCRFNDQHLI